MAGVSVRTLHHYDELELLVPGTRTPAGYRLYGEKELLRLQQILFYKELDLSLEEIGAILDDPEFGLLSALESHRAALQAKKQRLSILLDTIDKTILKLKGGPVMLPNEALYEGFPKETAAAWRAEAVEKWGSNAVESAEHKLGKKSKEDLQQLLKEGTAITEALAGLQHLAPSDTEVQEWVARHYAHILDMWPDKVCNDNPKAAYRGLADLYLADERYTFRDGKPNPAFAAFLSAAMKWFTDHR